MAPGKRITIDRLLARKKAGEKIVMLTAYDYTSARFADESGVDALLVGDSLGMVIQGGETTLAVTLEESLYHTRLVARAAKHAMVIGDMPFLTYQVSNEQAVANAGRYLKEAGAHAVKLEGGITARDRIAALVAAQIPVMAHVGMTPQSVNLTSGYRAIRDEDKVLADALACQEAGAFAIVLECIPESLAASVTRELRIPTIGIGASADCDGQVLVYHDMLGMFEDFTPKFVKHYATLAPVIRAAIAAYADEVRKKKFPAEKHTYK